MKTSESMYKCEDRVFYRPFESLVIHKPKSGARNAKRIDHKWDKSGKTDQRDWITGKSLEHS